MDHLDKKLFNDMNTQIEIPDEIDTIIKNGLNKKRTQYSILKKVASFFIITFITSGMVFAGSIVYEKNIWKEPQKVIGGATEENVSPNTPKENTISQEDARERGKEILEKFGYMNDEIKTITLQDNPANYNLNWNIETEQNILINFNANGEESFSIRNDNILNKDIERYRTTKKEAEDTARQLAEKYGYDMGQYNYVEVKSNLNSDSESYIWNVIFYKEYDGIKNPYESINIGFIPQINELYYFDFINQKFENNPIEITEEKAKEIAINEDQKISKKYEIKNIETRLGIVSMNGEAYLRANDYNQLQEQTSTANYPYEKYINYRTESRIRKSWIVTIIYNIPNNVNKVEGNYNVNDEKFSYFIDATSGEIIGGGSIY